MRREGPFWDFIAGRLPCPPAAALLGWQLVAIDPDAGTIETSFDATDRFTNPVGTIQGGFLTAMLDDTLGPALTATLAPDQFAPTIDIHVQFVRSALPGRLHGRGRVVHKGRDIAFLSGELLDGDDRIVATAHATAKIQSARFVGMSSDAFR